ncbi:FISUMP domain-containing protein [Riemerella anatipestifer]|nr:FISUMP domain-containing protein [Riemerella anatipestifer]
MKTTTTKLSVLAFLGLGLATGYGQDYLGRVGINTNTPKATLDIAKKELSTLPSGQPQGVLLPRLTTQERNTFTNVERGTMMFNTDKNCIDWYNGSYWACIDGSQADAPPTSISTPVNIDKPMVTVGGGKKFLFSVIDNNYSPYTEPTGPATWDIRVNPDTTTEPMVNLQGIITTKGIEIKLPVTSTGDTTLDATAILVTVPAEKTQDGIGRTLALSWPATAVTTSTSSITATIRALEGDLNIKKLDINAGIGNDKQGVELATFNYSSNGTPQTYQIRVLPGIPDRKFGIETNGELEHQFLYMTTEIVGSYLVNGQVYKKEWLSMNLGADYTNLKSPYFNPGRTWGSTEERIKDYHAYGSSFQWGRDSDGHELMNWTAPTQGTPKNLSQSWTAPTDLALITFTTPDPCPHGFHMPTDPEWDELHIAITGAAPYSGSGNSRLYNDSRFGATFNGSRSATNGAILDGQSFIGNWWSNYTGPYKWYRFGFNSSGSGFTGGRNPSEGNAIRCIKD